MTRAEAIENLLILKKSAEETVGNRQQNIEYTILHNIKPSSFSFVVDMAIEALKQEPCEDAISRQAVIDLVVANHIELNGVNVVMYSPLCKDIKQLSPVNPQPKTGHWYDKWGKDGCSVCNEGIDDAQTFDGRPFKYCPMCGARMSEVEE